jgi:hypothetical protein
VFQSFQTEGYRLKYFRIPISPEQAPDDNYFDEYINVIRNLEPTDPLIFNCGIGAVRSKFLIKLQFYEYTNNQYSYGGYHYCSNYSTYSTD